MMKNSAMKLVFAIGALIWGAATPRAWAGHWELHCITQGTGKVVQMAPSWADQKKNKKLIDQIGNADQYSPSIDTWHLGPRLDMASTYPLPNEGCWMELDTNGSHTIEFVWRIDPGDRPEEQLPAKSVNVIVHVDTTADGGAYGSSGNAYEPIVSPPTNGFPHNPLGTLEEYPKTIKQYYGPEKGDPAPLRKWTESRVCVIHLDNAARNSTVKWETHATTTKIKTAPNPVPVPYSADPHSLVSIWVQQADFRILAKPAGPWKYVENSPDSKIIDAWIRIGARPDAGNPDEETTYLTPFKTIWNAFQSATEWIGGEYHTIVGDGLDPSMNQRLALFWEGKAEFDLLSQLDGHAFFPSQQYQWQAVPDSLYVATDSNAAEREIRQAAASTSHKEFHFDFGPVDPNSLGLFPQTTTVYASSSTGGNLPLPSFGAATARINWHMRPVTTQRLEIKFDWHPNDGAPLDLSQQIYEKMQADANVIQTGAQLVATGINTLYIDPAKNYVYGPFLVAGFHAIGSLASATKRIAADTAEGIRAARAAQIGGDATFVKFTVNIEHGSDIGTVTQAAARSDAVATSTQAAETLTSTVTATGRADDAIAASDDAITEAKALKQALLDAGKTEEAAQVEAKIQKMQELRDDANAALTVAKTKKTEAITAAGKFTDHIEAIDNPEANPNFYEKLDAVSGTATNIANASRIANRGCSIAGGTVIDIGTLGKEAAQIGQAAGITHRVETLTASAERAESAGQAAIGAASAGRSNSLNLLSRNAKTIKYEGYAQPPTQCFVAGTSILMADGTHKPIDKIKAGDEVLSREEGSQEIKARKVLQTFSRRVSNRVVLHLGNEQIETTNGHPFYVDGQGFTRAEDLTRETRIVTRTGARVQLDSIQHEPGDVTVYNFEVEETHSYFVGHAELWVHNWCELPYVKDEDAWNWNATDKKLDPIDIYPDVDAPEGPITDLDKIYEKDGVWWVVEQKSVSRAAREGEGIIIDPKEWVKKQIEPKLERYLEALRSNSPDLPEQIKDPAKLLDGRTKIGIEITGRGVDQDLEEAVASAVTEFETKNPGLKVGIRYPWMA